MFLSFILLIPVLFWEALQHNVPWKLPYRRFRQLSTDIYYLHPAVYPAARILFSLEPGPLLYLLTLLACVALWAIFCNSKNTFVKKIL